MGLEPLSLRQYAARRGVSPMAVSRAIKTGRLTASVGRDADGTPRINDPELADREWDQRTDLSKAPGAVKARAAARPPPPPAPAPAADLVQLPPDVVTPEEQELLDRVGLSAHKGMTLAEASAIEKVWKAKLAELEFQTKSGELVAAKDVAVRLANVFTHARTKLLGIPTQAKQRLPHLTVPDLGLLERLVREALEDLAAGDVPKPPGDESEAAA